VAENEKFNVVSVITENAQSGAKMYPTIVLTTIIVLT